MAKIVQKFLKDQMCEVSTVPSISVIQADYFENHDDSCIYKKCLKGFTLVFQTHDDLESFECDADATLTTKLYKGYLYSPAVIEQVCSQFVGRADAITEEDLTSYNLDSDSTDEDFTEVINMIGINATPDELREFLNESSNFSDDLYLLQSNITIELYDNTEK